MKVFIYPVNNLFYDAQRVLKRRAPHVAEIDPLKFGTPELIASTSAERDLHLYKSALFPGIYNVGLIKYCCKKNDILPGLSYPSCCISWRKNAAPWERRGDAMVERKWARFLGTENFNSIHQRVRGFPTRDSRYLFELAFLHSGAPFRERSRTNCTSQYHREHPFDPLFVSYSSSWMPTGMKPYKRIFPSNFVHFTHECHGQL